MANKFATVKTLAWFRARRLLWRPANLVLVLLYGLWLLRAPDLAINVGLGSLGEPSPTSKAAHALGPMLGLWWLVWILHMAGVGQRLAQREAGWVGPAGIQPGTFVLSTWLGGWLAGSLVIACIFAWVGAWPGRSAPDTRVEAILSGGSNQRVAAGQTLVIPVEVPIALETDRFSIWVRPTYGPAPTTDARMDWVADEGDSNGLNFDEGPAKGPAKGIEDGTHESSDGALTKDPSANTSVSRSKWPTQWKVDGLRLLSSPAPPNSSAHSQDDFHQLRSGLETTGFIGRLTLTNTGAGDLGVLGNRGLLHRTPQSSLRHGLDLGLRASLIGALLSAFALMAGIWMRPTLAVPLVLTVAGALFGLVPTWLLNGNQVLEQMLAGIGPTPWPWLGLAGLIAATVGALSFAAAGLRSWGLNR